MKIVIRSTPHPTLMVIKKWEGALKLSFAACSQSYALNNFGWRARSLPEKRKIVASSFLLSEHMSETQFIFLSVCGDCSSQQKVFFFSLASAASTSASPPLRPRSLQTRCPPFPFFVTNVAPDHLGKAFQPSFSPLTSPRLCHFPLRAFSASGTTFSHSALHP